MTAVTQPGWEKLILRWTGVPEQHQTGEMRLIAYMLGDCLAHLQRPSQRGDWLSALRFFDRGFDVYARAIGLNMDFIRQQLERANAHEQ